MSSVEENSHGQTRSKLALDTRNVKLSKVGKLFQGVGKNNEGRQRVKGADVFSFVPREKLPNKKIEDVTRDRIAYTIREMKKYKHRARTTVGDNNVKYEGDTGTPTPRL